MKEDINICYCINKNHVDLTLKSISYIRKFFKNQKYKLKFFICSTDILKLPAGLNYINIQSDLNIIHQHCMLPDFINVDRMIYLDSDTIAMTCISKLWEIDIGNKIIGAAILKPIPTFGKLVHIFSFNFKPFIYYKEKPYYNTGVMLIDCKKWKQNDITNINLKNLQLYQHTNHKERCEPSINVTLVNNIFTIDGRWNHCPVDKFKKVYISHFYNHYSNLKKQHNLYH